MPHRKLTLKTLALGSCAIGALIAGPAAAEQFAVPSQELRAALQQFASQGDQQVLFSNEAVAGKRTAGFNGDASPEIALQQLLAGTDLTFRRNGDTFLVVSASDPQSGSAAGDGADAGTVQALIVTAQKREENIQDVPIAISAFTQEDLTRSQVAGGPDLITQVPNMTFTKTNFSSYSIQLRGIGTQAVSATTDPGVAVAFNNTPFTRNRFFEQEFYDLARVEVLRGPQGTLYGRNATAGVVNIISAKPKFTYESKLSADLGNYSSSRLEGMINLPLVEDKVALRLAGAWTKRDGYATNQLTGRPIDGRDLWSTRLSLRFTPSDRIDANLIWEHFEENDDRLRSGKQLCKKDVITHVGDWELPSYGYILADGGQGGAHFTSVQGRFSQGCVRESLYSPNSFETPNGLALPYYQPLGAIGLPVILFDPQTHAPLDPYVSATQSRDLRVIESTVDPRYRAKNDLGELQIAFDLTDGLTLTSETAYAVDNVYSLQDFNRFNTKPGVWGTEISYALDMLQRGVLKETPDGPEFCDPQLGCSTRLVAVDVASSDARQFSQELRLASKFDGPFNFSLGANFMRADSLDKYYVFINALTLTALSGYNSNLFNEPYVPNQSDNSTCLRNGLQPGDPSGVYSVFTCTYIDPNPIANVNDMGHNYFLSKNPYKLISYAMFGEAYYNVTDRLKITAGLRWTVDKKEAPRIPSWLLVAQTAGYPVAEDIRQQWREPTGRLTVDWKPDLGFTDETLLYASYAHGYKAGGANPPSFVRTYYSSSAVADANTNISATRPKTFQPEFVNAFELGAKNTLLEGKATLNLAAFYYDYTGYQVSEIVDRSAYNRNFDATIWGIELESEWRPLENLKFGVKAGYEKTRIANGEQAVDLMDRTAGRAGWVVFRPFPTYASNCILPTWLFFPPSENGRAFSPGTMSGGGEGPCETAYLLHRDPVTDAPYTATPYAPDAPTPGPSSTLNLWSGLYPGWDPASAPNNGEGFYKQLGGNELPNAPHWTATATADYSIPLPSDWLMTLHSDVHWQSQSWWRVFNDNAYDKLHPYFTMNLAAIFTNEERGWNIMAYVKNVTDETAITGAFLNSDDVGLTTNVFLTEPRLYGLRVTKAWSGGPWWTGANPNHRPGEPYPFTVELSGQVQRHEAPYETLSPSFIGQFSDAIDPTVAQHRHLDWGDGREVRITYRPGAGQWFISGAARYGKTNSETTRLHRSEFGAEGCLFGGQFAMYCDPSSSFYNKAFVKYASNWSDAAVKTNESHNVVDFKVGRDLGLGLFGDGHSSVATGIRYAGLESKTHAWMQGRTDLYMPAEWIYVKYSHFNVYNADIEAEREFKGAGPTLTWDGAKPVLGNEDTGHLSVDWSLTGGVLFGKQKTSVTGEQTSGYWEGKYRNTAFAPVRYPDLTTTPLGIPARSKSVSVPLVDLSLGLSYDIQRIKVSTGYRWERYFNVLDTGYAEHKDADQTIDGPYFKIAVGFGG